MVLFCGTMFHWERVRTENCLDVLREVGLLITTPARQICKPVIDNFYLIYIVILIYFTIYKRKVSFIHSLAFETEPIMVINGPRRHFRILRWLDREKRKPTKLEAIWSNLITLSKISFLWSQIVQPKNEIVRNTYFKIFLIYRNRN